MKRKNQFINFIKGGLTVLISVLIIFTVVKASTDKITPPTGAPAATFYSLSEIYNFINSNTTATVASPDLDWSANLEDTGNTLTEIYDVLKNLISINKVKLGTTYLGKTGTLTPIMTDGTATTTAVVADIFSGKTAHLTEDWTLDTGTLNLACNTAAFDGTSNLVATTYDGAGDGANRWCMATSTNSASASDIVRYKSAWVNGVETSGSFASSTETATTTGVDITPTVGSYFSKITVAITNLVATVIKSGETVGGVDGSLLPSTGTAIPGNVATGTTFFGASQTNWTLQTGIFDPWTPQKYVRWDDWRYGAGTTGSPFNEYIGEEATWPSTDAGGDAVKCVTDNATTTCLYSNAVKQDTRTGLYWSDRTNTGGATGDGKLDNEFRYDATGQCNFTDTGVANTYCDNQDPTSAYTEDNDVSANDFCLNLELDANDDATLETDWRLPSQKELMQAYIDGSANNLPNPDNYFWSATEQNDNAARAWAVPLRYGATDANTKATAYSVRCVRP